MRNIKKATAMLASSGVKQVEPEQLAAAGEMQARMMWAIDNGVRANGVRADDVRTLAVLRDMNRKQRLSFLARKGKRTKRVAG
jgi:hypothetical protein